MADGTIFALDEFKPLEAEYMQRGIKFGTYRRYYDGTIYRDTAFRVAHKLYAETRSMFSFLARAVDLDVALTPGVNAPWEIEQGALAESVYAEVAEARDLLYRWSKWATAGDAWLEDGATLGEAYIKIVPRPERSAVQMQRLKPEVTLLRDDMALIVDRNAKDERGERYEYAEAITPQLIRTFKNGEPFGFQSDAEGNPSPRFPNPLGVVPVVRADNDVGARPTFAKLLNQLDAVNELASYLANVIGRHVEPQWAITGAEPSTMTKSGDNVWFFPKDAKAEALLAEIDIDGTLEFIREVKAEAKANLPELAFDDLRAKDQIATETLQVQLVELDAKIWKMRRRYDMALIEAHQMAALAASVYGIGDISALLVPHEMDYRRPVRPVSRLDEIRLEEAELALSVQQTLASGERLTATAGAMTELVRGE